LRCLEGCWLLNCCNTKRSLCKAAAGIAGGALQEQDPTPTPPRPAVASCQLRCQPLGNYGAACSLAHDFHTNQLLVGWLNRSQGSTNSTMECKVMQTMALISCRRDTSVDTQKDCPSVTLNPKDRVAHLMQMLVKCQTIGKFCLRVLWERLVTRRADKRQ
jgi:hypothetical protein